MDIFSNPWTVTIGGGVIVSFICYYFLGIGKSASTKNNATGKRGQFLTWEDARQKEYEIELESFRNDMIRRGLAHSSIRKNGEEGLRKKFEIKKIFIIGISGTGKTTIAQKLSEITHIPVFHLDRCIWLENWVEAPQKRAEEGIDKILVHDEWIIEGFINPSAKAKLELADLVLYFDYSGLRAAFGGLRRWWQYRGSVRPELPAGCIEEFNWKYLKVMFKRLERPEIEEAIAPYQNKTIRLQSPAQIKKFLMELREEYNLPKIG